MSTAQAIPAPVIDDIDNEDDDFIKVGDWTKERHELKITAEEFDAESLRLQAEHPEEYLSPEKLQEKIRRIQAERTVGYHAEMVGV